MGASKVAHVEPDNHILWQHFQSLVHALMKKCVFSETRNKWLLIFIYVLFWGDLWEMREMEKKSRNQDARRNRNACCWGRETGEGETENRGGCQTEENKKKR